MSSDDMEMLEKLMGQIAEMAMELGASRAENNRLKDENSWLRAQFDMSRTVKP